MCARDQQQTRYCRITIALRVKEVYKHTAMVKAIKKSPSTKEYLCYCLKSTTHANRTYVGITNNFTRRIRQHNGELVGGARYTHAYRPWRPLFRVHGFKTKRDVLRFEWAMKHRRRSRKGASPDAIRCLTLEYLLSANPKESTAPMVQSLHKHLHVEVLLSKEAYLKHTVLVVSPHVRYTFVVAK